MVIKHARNFLLVIWHLGISFAVFYLLLRIDAEETVGSINTCNLQETLKIAKQNTLRIDRDDGGHGTGFIIGKDGYIATNNHVVVGANSLQAYSPYWSQGMKALNSPGLGGDTIGGKQVTVIKTDPDLDIAILKMSDVDVDTIPFSRDPKDFDYAEPLYTIGWPNEKTFGSIITGGIYSESFPNLIKKGGPSEVMIQTDAPINPGNSGGPLVDKCGVVGMVTSKLTWVMKDTPVAVEGVGYAISINDIKLFFEKSLQKK